MYQNICFVDSTGDDFLQQLDITCNIGTEECRSIWRQIVLRCVINPSSALPGAKWLFSYAERFPSNDLRHASTLYVALNLLLFAHGPLTFTNCPDIDIFKMLDDIGRHCEENGDQSKQISPVHKMAHIWGTAAVAFYLKSDHYRYLVCACMMRVSFELLDICFSSSGIESLFALAHKHAPNFLSMMATDPSIKLSSPKCINYFRRELDNSSTCIRYSMETVDRFVKDSINLDQTDLRM
jgi:hypothetical protein